MDRRTAVAEPCLPAGPGSWRRRALAARPDRRRAILLAAEKLFAQRGYHAVTIRQIAEEAGVPLALVGYYHGQKHELFAAVFEHWSQTNDERLAGLRSAVDAGGPDLLRRVVEAFVQPVLRLRASVEGEYHALLVARELACALPEADTVLRSYFDPSIFLIKITPLNPTYRAREKGLSSYIEPYNETSTTPLVEKLSADGYQVIISIGELEENLIGSNCGQYIRRHLSAGDPIEDGYTYCLAEYA